MTTLEERLEQYGLAERLEEVQAALQLLDRMEESGADAATQLWKLKRYLLGRDDDIRGAL